ncbi:hypothetical protein [Actinoallomurus soli]|uniref:hypothetical protein n=1 Tax=Actinoallomurus soli TaxID=2952535 RepID=UPI002093A27B|nr:hypothetical protein [Actinoallomurus soli]MCO5967325.1 hypothetical protein [Actinoallomurus soli]
MLLKLTGSSCSGKSTLAFSVADRFQRVAVHDFDEIGVPERPDRHWRHRMTELWMRRALEYQDCGIDLLLTGQSPLGEVLAAPSAPLLDGIAVCLVDVADEVRRHRLTARDAGRWDAAAVDAFLGWAAWHRGHALDPRHRPDVIINGSWSGMVWQRWAGWTAGDPRWRHHVLDTTGRSVAASVDRVEQWVTEQRDSHRAGRLALSRGWADKSILPTDHHA